MNTTTLNNHIIDIIDFKSMLVMDLSDYNPDITPSNTYLEVWPPNFSSQIVYDYIPSTNTIINSNSLGWTNGCLTSLPDGLWTIKQSICPNDEIYLIKYHLRILNSQALIAKEMLKSLEQCDDKAMAKWYDMMKDLETAKYLAEFCEELNKAKALFNSVVLKLTNCSTC